MVELPDSTRTSAEAAAAVGVELGQIAKSLVFFADGEPVMVVLSGADRVDMARLREHLGAAAVERGDADRVRQATGFPIGGVSPLAHPRDLRVLIDRGLAAYPAIWAAGGTPNAVFPTTYEELLAVSGAEVAEVAEVAEDAEDAGAASPER